VVANLSRAAREGVEIDVRYGVGAGRRLAHDEIGERLRSADAPAEPGALATRRAVALGRECVEADQRRIVRVRRGEAHVAAALGMIERGITFEHVFLTRRQAREPKLGVRPTFAAGLPP